MYQHIFEILGFKDIEARTYLCLLENGASTGGDIAKAMGLPRPTAYNYLEQLANGGLASRSLHKNVRIYTAEPPSRIKLLYDKKMNDLKAQESAVSHFVSHLEMLRPANTHPRVQFFEGRAEVENALLDMLNYADITTRGFWSIHTALRAVSEDFFWYFNKERIKRNIFMKGIWPEYREDYIKRYPFQGSATESLREIRVAPSKLQFSMSCRIYVNKVLAFSSEAENFCFMIESAEYAEMISGMHSVIWDISTPISSSNKDMQPFLSEL